MVPAVITSLLFSYRYIASRTFARWLLYPGSTSLLNSMIGKCEIYTIMILGDLCFIMIGMGIWLYIPGVTLKRSNL